MVVNRQGIPPKSMLKSDVIHSNLRSYEKTQKNKNNLSNSIADLGDPLQ